MNKRKYRNRRFKRWKLVSRNVLLFIASIQLLFFNSIDLCHKLFLIICWFQVDRYSIFVFTVQFLFCFAVLYIFIIFYFWMYSNCNFWKHFYFIFFPVISSVGIFWISWTFFEAWTEIMDSLKEFDVRVSLIKKWKNLGFLIVHEISMVGYTFSKCK